MPTTHRVWKYGDHIDTDLIFPGKDTYTISHDPTALAQHALLNLDPEFHKHVQRGDVIVAGRNWGNGSSREQAVTCLLAAGVYAVVAASFARIYYRNAINNGLLVVECAAALPYVQTGDQIMLDIQNSTLTCSGGTFAFPTLPHSVQRIVQAGGLIPYLKQNA